MSAAETTHTEKGQDRREQILRASLSLFAQKGIEATGLRDIAREVGITQPTLYHYFPSKEHLVEGLILWHGERAAASQQVGFQQLMAAPTLRAGLQRMTEHILTNWNEPTHKAFFRVMMSEFAQGSPTGAVMYASFIRPRKEAATRMFQALIASGKVRDMDPELLTLQLMGPILFGSLLHNSSDDFRLTDERMREFVFQHVETLVRGIERT